MPIEFTPNPRSLKKLDYVVCHRTKDLPRPTVPAETLLCCKCSEQVWRALNSPKKPPAICLQCIQALITSADDVTMFLGQRVAASVVRGDTHPDVAKLIELAVRPKRNS